MEATMADWFLSYVKDARERKEEGSSSTDHCSFSSNFSSIKNNSGGIVVPSLLISRPSHSLITGDGSSSCWPSSSTSEEERTLAALRTHSEAERRRRERINAHLCALRRLIPNSSKMDKASLLGRVVEEVKDLERKASEIGKISRIPTELNEVKVELYEDEDANRDHESSSRNHANLCIRVSICCDDRPDLYGGLVEAFNRLRLRTIRAEMLSMGGRVLNVFVLTLKNGNYDEKLCLGSLKESITEVLASVAFSDISSNFISKRRRVLQSCHSNKV